MKKIFKNTVSAAVITASLFAATANASDAKSSEKEIDFSKSEDMLSLDYWRNFMGEIVTPQNWSGSVEGGINIHSGNTDSTDYNAEINLENKHGRWSHELHLEALAREENDSRTAEKYRISGRDNYLISERAFVFGDLEYTKDRFSGYDYRVNETLGFGYIFADDEVWKLKTRAGIGGEHTKDETGDHADKLLGKLGANAAYKLNENVSITEDAEALLTDDLQTYRSKLALKTKLSESLAFRVGYNIEHLSQVPAGKKKTDQHTFLGLVYDF